MSFRSSDPGPGDPVPGFDLPTLDGGRFRFRYPADTGPALLVFGSATCPVTDNAAPGLNELHHRFGDRVRFVMVTHAERLRDLHGFAFEVALDDVDGNIHRALSPKPNSAYVLGADGTIRFRAQWANDMNGLAAALESVVADETPGPAESGGIVQPTLRMLPNIAPALDRAGASAWADMWRAVPPLAAMAFVLKVLRVRPRTRVTVGAHCASVIRA